MSGLCATAFARTREAAAGRRNASGRAKTTIDAPLLIARAALFGAGWGLVGLCPGPALADLAHPLSPKLIVFVVAMVAGMMAHDWWRAGASLALPKSAPAPADG